MPQLTAASTDRKDHARRPRHASAASQGCRGEARLGRLELPHANQILSVEGLSRGFGRREVLRRLDVTLLRGERLAVRGQNGSGKTTLLRCIAGTLAPSSGRVTVEGHPAGSLPACGAMGVSLSQERSFHLRLSGHEQLLFAARLRGAEPRSAGREVAAVEEELELGAVAARRVDKCSTGMVQQLAFARALLCDPRLLLLDEPTRSLDKEAMDRLWAALDRRPSAAVVLATHRQDDLDRCPRSLDLSL